MKTVLEQLMEIQDKLDALKLQAQPEMECNGGCGCGDRKSTRLNSSH